MAKFKKLTDNFTVIPNEIFNIENVSVEAKYVYIYLRSKPETWKPHMTDVQRSTGMGRTRVMRCRSELIDAGMLSYQALKEGGGVYTLHEITDAWKPDNGKPVNGKPTPIVKTDLLVKTDKYKKPEVPEFINSEIWDDFVQHRKERRSPLKPTTLKRLIKDLTKWKSEGDDPNDILVTSIRNGWTGVFKPKAKQSNKKSTNGSSVQYVPDEELNAWAKRNNAPQAKQQIGYTYDKYRADLIAWEQAR